MIVLIVLMWLYVVGALIRLITPADPDDSTAVVVAGRLGSLVRLAALVIATLLLQNAYL